MDVRIDATRLVDDRVERAVGRAAERCALAVVEAGGVVTVRAAADKPADPSEFNAFWGMVTASEEEAYRLPDVVSEGADSPLAGAVALMVEGIVNYNTVDG